MLECWQRLMVAVGGKKLLAVLVVDVVDVVEVVDVVVVGYEVAGCI